jgi:prefoldin subunit 5
MVEKRKELMKMQEYIRMKIDYLRRSKERLRELESDIDCLIENVPSTEKAVTERRFRSEIEDLRKEVEELELDVAEMSVSNSDSWEWALEIENTEWLFKVLKERVDQAKEIMEENKSEVLAGANSELVETKTKG